MAHRRSDPSNARSGPPTSRRRASSRSTADRLDSAEAVAGAACASADVGTGRGYDALRLSTTPPTSAPPPSSWRHVAPRRARPGGDGPGARRSGHAVRVRDRARSCSRSRRSPTSSTASSPDAGRRRPRSAPSSTRPPTSCSSPARCSRSSPWTAPRPWVAMIIVGREILILGLKGAAAIAGKLVKPSFWGKAKANRPVPRDHARDRPTIPGADRAPLPRRVRDGRGHGLLTVLLRGRVHRPVPRRRQPTVALTRPVTAARVLVTGGSGVVGRALVERLRSRRPRRRRARRAAPRPPRPSAGSARRRSRGDVLDAGSVRDGRARVRRPCSTSPA